MSGVVCQGQGRLDASGVPPSAWEDAHRRSSEEEEEAGEMKKGQKKG